MQNCKGSNETISFFYDVKQILKSNCEVLYKRLQSEIDKGNIKIAYEIEDMLEELSMTRQELIDLLKHVSKTYIVKPGYKNLGVKWVLNNVNKVKNISELQTELQETGAQLSMQDGILRHNYTAEQLNELIDNIEDIEI